MSKVSKIVSLFWGILGAINSSALGLYIFLTYNAFSNFLELEQLHKGYLAASVSMFCSILIIYGTYLIGKDERKGGIINLLAGTILCTVYLFLVSSSSPRILDWLGPLGFFLPTPVFLSGLTAILAKP
jgi:hypothetical protein